jgi:hypothetical protein
MGKEEREGIRNSNGYDAKMATLILISTETFPDAQRATA